MRAIFYTDDQMDAAYRHWVPRLCDYAAECRRRNPIPDRASLAADQRAQYDILESVLDDYRDTPVYIREPFVEIIHGSPLTLLAAESIFGAKSASVILLLSNEFQKWLANEFYRAAGDLAADGWFRSTWVTVHDTVPDCFTKSVATYFPEPRGFRYWVLTKARLGSAAHQLWQWDGRSAQMIGMVGEQCTEEGFIDNLDHWPVEE